MGMQDVPYHGVASVGVGFATGVVTPVHTCPLCHETVQADALGLVECGCGWGGPDDPIEAARGLSRFITRLDRQLATGQARRELLRIAKRGGQPAKPGVLYRGLLVLGATVVYLAILGIAAVALWLMYTGVHDQAWLELVLGALLALILVLPVIEHRSRQVGIVATSEQFPALFVLLRETESAVGARLPRRVVLSPGAGFSIGRRHPLRRFFLPETTLTLGAGALPLLHDVEVRSIVAHELAHARHGDTILHRYALQAEIMIKSVIETVISALSAERASLRRSPRRSRSVGSGGVMLGVILGEILMLPISLLFMIFHLIRLRESRMAEYRADAIAVRAFGASAFINGLTGATVTQETLLNSGKRLLATGPNYYERLTGHYRELPPSVIASLRTKALTGYRSLQQTHPITADRVRAALIIAQQHAMPPAPSGSARGLLVRAGETSPEATELELTALLRNGGKRKKRGAGN